MTDYENILNESLKKFPQLTPIQIKNCVQLYKNYDTYIKEKKQIDWSKVIPIKDTQFANYTELPEPNEAEVKLALGQIAVIKLNGGLGTSMGCSGPKALLPVRQGLSFLDFTIKQLETINKKYGVDVPLILMNSFNTEADTKAYLAKTQTTVKIFHFNQFELPRMDAATMLPAELSQDQQYYPPGHGYVWECIRSSGTAQQLLDKGIKWVFSSNCDNLGAVLDAKIAHFAIQSKKQFVSEQTLKSEADVKGGVLIEYEGATHLLETAQVPPSHMDDFCDTKMFKFFHINNLWCNLEALMKISEIHLDLIVNPKTVENKRVIQLEVASGAMIANFASVGLVVPRSRFQPVKKSGDLLLLQSDCYSVDEGFLLNQVVPKLPLVVVNALVNDFYEMFKNVPSLKDALTVEIDGKVNCGKNVSIKGNFHVKKEETVKLNDNQTYGQ